MYKQRGLSLVELMIAVALGLILMTGVIQMFLSSRAVFATQQGLSRIQENGRLAMEFMSRDIRMAGFMGCADRENPQIENRLASPGSFTNRMTIAIEGFDDIPAGSNLSPAPLDDTDVLVLRGATGAQALLADVSSSTALTIINTGSVAGACPGDVASLSGICPGDTLVVSDCVKTQIFSASSVAVAGDDIEVEHTTGNASQDWGDNIYQAGTEVLGMNHVVYYIANNASGQPSLYQNINGVNPSLELLEGVEAMSLTYSFEASPTEYKPAADIGTNWANVGSVRVELLLRSLDDRLLEEPQIIDFAGEELEFDDLRMRQVFSSVVGIRSRLP